MGKKRKKGKKSRARRYASRAVSTVRRYSKPSKANFQEILISGAAAAGGGVLSGILADKIPMPNPKMKPLIPIAGGLLLGSTAMGKGKIGKAVAIGMVAAGALAFAKNSLNLPVLAGDGENYEYYGGDDELIDYDDADLMGYDVDDDDDDDDLDGDYSEYGDYDEFSGWQNNR